MNRKTKALTLALTVLLLFGCAPAQNLFQSMICKAATFEQLEAARQAWRLAQLDFEAKQWGYKTAVANLKVALYSLSLAALWHAGFGVVKKAYKLIGLVVKGAAAAATLGEIALAIAGIAELKSLYDAIIDVMNASDAVDAAKAAADAAWAAYQAVLAEWKTEEKNRESGWYNDDNPIQKMIRLATEYAVLIIPAGIFGGGIIVWKALTIIAADGNLSTVINGSGWPDCFTVLSPDVTISGFTVANSSDSGISIVGSDNVSISDNVVEDTQCGIFSAHSNNNTIRNNFIGNNTEYGVLTFNTNNSLIDNNDVSSIHNEGIMLNGSYYNDVVNNRIANCDKNGINLQFSSNNTISNNTVQFNLEYGVQVDFYCANNSIFNNTLGENHLADVWITPMNEYNSFPSVGIEIPEAGEIRTSAAIMASGSAAEGTVDVEVQVNEGSWQTANGTTSWNVHVVLLAPINTISVRATNADGEEYIITIYAFWLDNIGDLNGDGTVDIYDAILLANAYGYQLGSPKWKSYADINGDGFVDIYDAIILSNHFNKHIP